MIDCEPREMLNRLTLSTSALYSFLPIVALALVFNLSNVLGFTCRSRLTLPLPHSLPLPRFFFFFRPDQLCPSSLIPLADADRDAKQRWSNSVSNAGSILGGLGSMGGFGAQMAGGALRQGLGRMMG